MVEWATAAAAVAAHPCGGVLLPPTPAAVPAAAALHRHPFRAKLPQLPGSMAELVAVAAAMAAAVGPLPAAKRKAMTSSRTRKMHSKMMTMHPTRSRTRIRLRRPWWRERFVLFLLVLLLLVFAIGWGWLMRLLPVVVLVRCCLASHPVKHSAAPR